MENSEKKTPAIRFPEFKENWKHKRLSELLSESKKRNTDLRFNKEQVLSVSGELGIVNQIEHLGRSYAGESVHNYHIVETNDIVYTKSPLKANPYGIIRLNKGNPGIVSTLYAVYNVRAESALGAFLDYYFSLDANTNRYLRPLVKKGAKNDMKINNSYVLVDKIFVPEIEEQRKITAFLTVVDKKIQQLTEKKTLLEQYKKGVMQKILNQEIRFKDDKGNDFADWEEKKIGDYVDIISGFAFKGEDISEDSSGVPLLRGANITEGKIRHSSEIDRFYVGSLSKLEKYILQVGDLVIGMDGSKVGKNSALITEKDSNSLLIQRVARLRSKNNSSLPFIYQHINSIQFQDYVEKVKTSSGIAHISLKQINDFKMFFPSFPEQQKFANFLSAIDDKINLVNHQIEKTQTFKKGLLQQMFV